MNYQAIQCFKAITKSLLLAESFRKICGKVFLLVYSTFGFNRSHVIRAVYETNLLQNNSASA
jgi:hypothetical protein